MMLDVLLRLQNALACKLCGGCCVLCAPPVQGATKSVLVGAWSRPAIAEMFWAPVVCGVYSPVHACLRAVLPPVFMRASYWQCLPSVPLCMRGVCRVGLLGGSVAHRHVGVGLLRPVCLLVTYHSSVSGTRACMAGGGAVMSSCMCLLQLHRVLVAPDMQVSHAWWLAGPGLQIEAQGVLGCFVYVMCHPLWSCVNAFHSCCNCPVV